MECLVQQHPRQSGPSSWHSDPAALLVLRRYHVPSMAELVQAHLHLSILFILMRTCVQPNVQFVPYCSSAPRLSDCSGSVADVILATAELQLC